VLLAVALRAASPATLDGLEAWLTGDPDRFVARARLVMAGLAAGVALPPVLLAAVIWRQGIWVTREGRFPPAGTRLVRDVPVLEGADARRRGQIILVLAALLMAAAGVLLWLLWRLTAALSSSLG
jgi:hypothetical protein